MLNCPVFKSRFQFNSGQERYTEDSHNNKGGHSNLEWVEWFLNSVLQPCPTLSNPNTCPGDRQLAPTKIDTGVLYLVSQTSQSGTYLCTVLLEGLPGGSQFDLQGRAVSNPRPADDHGIVTIELWNLRHLERLQNSDRLTG